MKHWEKAATLKLPGSTEAGVKAYFALGTYIGGNMRKPLLLYAYNARHPGGV